MLQGVARDSKPVQKSSTTIVTRESLAERIRQYDLDAAAVAETLGLSESAIRAAASSGRLKSIRVGSHMRFKLSDVLDYLGLPE